MTRRATAAEQFKASGLETHFNAAFTTELALREKQIQQNYRPVIGVHKWFARRPGTVFRSLLLSEFCPEVSPQESYWKSHRLSGVIGDPFMGGGTPVYEANRLGFHVVGCDINPMAYWIVRQSLTPLDLEAFQAEAAAVITDLERKIGEFYRTRCLQCGDDAQVKYFLWVKTTPCPHCGERSDLFPGYRLAEAERHPLHVLACSDCGALNEFEEPPVHAHPGKCTTCGGRVHLEGTVQRKHVDCRKCGNGFRLSESFSAPLPHRMWAIEYHCVHCYADHPGRQFKAPEPRDLERVELAQRRLSELAATLPLPADEIPRGDETDRLHRWGYRRYQEMFNERQLLGLGLLLERIRAVRDLTVRNALLTVFSDTLRYQNMLCRYDTYALKCQDIFSVHGFPVGLVQCENSLLGLTGVGSGSFRHFVEKYLRAKEYCAAPFETRQVGKRKELVSLPGESIEAQIVDHFPRSTKRKQAFLMNAPSQRAPLEEGLLDGVFTDPPYFDNVQYAELIDFCFAWLRQGLADEFEQFRRSSTRSADELTGNETLGRGLEHFTQGLSEVFCHFTRALKPGAPFVFTYHHNDPNAYLPLIVAILDAGLHCTATLPAAAEMTASLHIAGTKSSSLDSVFVCRRLKTVTRSRSAQLALPLEVRAECAEALAQDAAHMRSAGVKVSLGDLRCLLAGHMARLTIRMLRSDWDVSPAIEQRLEMARQWLHRLMKRIEVEAVVRDIAERGS